MESYPEELLVGVSPLVFCVDASLQEYADREQTLHEMAGSAPPGRGQFEKFLDALAGCLIQDDDQQQQQQNQGSFRGSSLFPGLVSPSQEDDSDGADDALLTPVASKDGGAGGDPAGGAGAAEYSPRTQKSILRSGSSFFGTSPKQQSQNNSNSTSYALQNELHFFQRARIQSIGVRHGFPPSQDASGAENRVLKFLNEETSTFDLQALLQDVRSEPSDRNKSNNPIQGILPSGWLEKHAQSLPSVLILVASVYCDNTQPTQDDELLQVVENLAESLAGKRQVQIHIVGLVQDGVSNMLAAQWILQLTQKLEASGRTAHGITILELSELSSDNSVPSQSLKELHSQVRDASLQYYTTQAKRVRLKLSLLGNNHMRTSPTLLPFVIRYCFKLAVWYEFQWKHDKRILFLQEAYKHCESYYKYLLQKSDGSSSLPPLPPLVDRAASTGVELSLDTTAATSSSSEVSDHAVDMVYQCRAVADWLNFMLLKAGFGSMTESGVVAASQQWRCHTASFLSASGKSWYEWEYVAQQRAVVGQLLERYPTTKLELSSRPGGQEHQIRCSAWRTYQAAAEATLQLNHAVHVQLKHDKDGVSSESNKLKEHDDAATRYLGGLDATLLKSQFQQTSKQNFLEKALEFLKRSLPLFEKEYEKETNKKDGHDAHHKQSWSRSGARLYYLMGGTLMGLKQHKEAVPNLVKSLNMVQGWGGLETTLQTMLLQCYEHVTPELTDDSTSTMLLEACFRTRLSNEQLRQVLSKLSFLNTSADKSLKWNKDCFDESDAKLPISYSLNFPTATHATAGDTIPALLTLQSNLEYAVELRSVALMGFGQDPILIPENDFEKTAAKDPGDKTGKIIILEPHSTVTISTSFELPTNLEDPSSSDSPEDKKAAAKSAFSKSARPRTGGITTGAGARWIYSESADSKQWSTLCLGGKSLKCDGLKVKFALVSDASSSATSSNIALTISKKRPEVPLNVKRTPFEEDNYISSAWSRIDKEVPLQAGPRCIRVLAPTAQLQVTNLTSLALSSNNALEGTVHRILLRIEPGPLESVCSNVEYNVSCSSSLLEEAKRLKILSPSDQDNDKEPFASLLDKQVRAPVLLRQSSDGSASVTEYGTLLPDGWDMLGKNGQGGEEYIPLTADSNNSLSSGNAAYAVIDLYRPLPTLTKHDNDGESSALDRAVCQTEVNVELKYRQTRADGSDDAVSMEYQTNITWSAPLSAVFSPGPRQSHPCGNRHPSNAVPDPDSTGIEAIETELVLMDGERVTTKCNIEAASEGLLCDLNLSQIRFEESSSQEDDAPCSFALVSATTSSGKVLYQAEPEDPCRHLQQGSKFAVSWTTDVNMKDEFKKGSVSSSLGVISVDWQPTHLAVPDEVADQKVLGGISGHGPLLLDSASTCRFMGPPCYIEHAPFHAVLGSLPTCPKVAVPFDISYRIRNKTHLVQKLLIHVDEQEVSDATELEGLILSGLVKGDVQVGPGEEYILTYSAIPTRTGTLSLPKLSIASDRHKTWIVNESLGSRRSLFVIP